MSGTSGVSGVSCVSGMSCVRGVSCEWCEWHEWCEGTSMISGVHIKDLRPGHCLAARFVHRAATAVGEAIFEAFAWQSVLCSTPFSPLLHSFRNAQQNSGQWGLWPDSSTKGPPPSQSNEVYGSILKHLGCACVLRSCWAYWCHHHCAPRPPTAMPRTSASVAAFACGECSKCKNKRKMFCEKVKERLTSEAAGERRSTKRVRGLTAALPTRCGRPCSC